MLAAEILGHQGHRPWPVHSGKWRFYQEWNEVLFLHWKVEEVVLKRFVPECLEIDLYEGQAWISMVAFKMENVLFRDLPSFAPVSNFLELNIRTYVKHKGKAGVYFLSIEAGSRMAAWLAKNISELPYRYSKMAGNSDGFESSDSETGSFVSMNYEVLDPLVKKSDLDIWLTERYALFQENGRDLNSYEIHHLEWPIFNVNFKQFNLDYPRFDKLFSGEPDMTHYSSGVKVLAWEKQKLGFN